MKILAIIVFVLIACAAKVHASELGYSMYLGIELDSKRPFFGVRWGAQDPVRLQDQSNASNDEPRTWFDLRYGGNSGSVLTLNGVPIESVSVLQAAGGTEHNKTNDTVDWKQVAGVAIGVGLIAAIAAPDRVKIKACSGSPLST